MSGGDQAVASLSEQSEKCDTSIKVVVCIISTKRSALTGQRKAAAAQRSVGSDKQQLATPIVINNLTAKGQLEVRSNPDTFRSVYCCFHIFA